MRDIKRILLFLLLIAGGDILSQVDSVLLKKSNPKQLKRQGKNAVQQHDPSSAIVFFEAYLKTNKNDAGVLYLLAQAYYEIGDYENAEINFIHSYASMHDKNSEALYYFAQMQKSNGKYDSARINFQKFKK